jgi:serine/threonine-protein kinase
MASAALATSVLKRKRPTPIEVAPGRAPEPAAPTGTAQTPTPAGTPELEHDAEPTGAPVRTTTLARGERVGAWRVDSSLGQGGMGSVYAVTHSEFGKRAALKLCHAALLGTRFTIDTFLREARVVHLVDHPGVCDVFATGIHEGLPYLAMERLAGRTLAAHLERRPLAREDALALLIELCDVLGAAHAAGIVHRDLKLDNVFVLDTPGPGGRRTKLLDWGIARIIGVPDPMRGMIAGTLMCIAPEQLLGDDIGPAADVYALAVLAYQLLFGAPPFTGACDLVLLRAHLNAEPPRPGALWPKIPAGLEELLLAMLSKDPAARPSIGEVARILTFVRAELRERARGWFARLIAPSPRPDALGRPAVRLRVRQQLVGATIGLAGLIASIASLLSA